MNFPEIDFTPVSHPYPETTMFGAIAASAKRVPDAPALNFMGRYTTYKQFVEKIEMTAVKDLLGLTGYIRGGCSPIGMKKKFPTYFDATAADHEKITVSAGVRGAQMLVEREVLVRFVDGKLIDVAR